MRDDARSLGGSAARQLGRRISAWLEALGQVVRRVAGMPDYRAFVHHCRQRHPGRPVPAEREYFEQYLESRYGGGINRCC